MARLVSIALSGVACVALVQARGQADDRLAVAEQFLLHGNYEESLEAYGKLRGELPVQAALGTARCMVERGQLSEAAATLAAALEGHADSPDLSSLLAEVQLTRGEHAEAAANVDRALRSDADHLHARWLQAELHRLAGRVDEAAVAYQWFADQWDLRGRTLAEPRELRWLGLGLAQHARWNRDKSRFPQLVGELYPRALELNAGYWPAHFDIGRLLAEKFNEADAAEAFGEALRINPRAAEAHAAVAQLVLAEFSLAEARQHIGRALAANPSCLPAHWAQADVEFASLRPASAQRVLVAARSLNPVHEETLSRLAAAYQLQRGPRANDAADGLDFDALRAEVQQRNPRPGEFHAAWSAALELGRRYPASAAQLAKAVESLPQLISARGQLGLLEMRLGNEAAARKLLEESFEIDPYNLRVKNQLEVLDLLDQYTTIETEHFTIRFDGEHDARLGRCLAEYAEVCYADLAQAFGYELPRRAVLEVFHTGRGHAGAEWFGVRMVGLPNIHTIAACGGNIVAMMSPSEQPGKLNWADVVRHELVHLFNLQQTDYSVPHWFTEGAAVWLEGRPRREAWNRLLAERGPKGELFDLESINQAFIRPRTSDDWQLAYCQAELYAECLLEEFGDDALARMLSAYAENRSTADALQHAFGIDEKALEAAYQRRLRATLVELQGRRQFKPDPDIAKLEAECAEDPKDARACAELALARLNEGDYPEAGRRAAAALEADADQPVARFVRAKLLVRIGDEEEAIRLIEPVASAEEPLPEAVEFLAGLRLRRNELDAAAQWYDRGAELEPGELSWTKARAAVAVKRGDAAAVAPLLEDIAAAEPDNLLVRKKLLQLAAVGGDARQVARWADEVLHIDVNDGAAHRELAQSLLKLEEPRRAAEHFEMAADLLPNRDELLRAAAGARAAVKGDEP